MAVTPIRKYQARVLPALESTFGVAVDPAAGQYVEVRSINMGPASTGVIRPKQDRALGRGMQNDFVEGRKQLVPWSLEAAVMGRSAVDAVPAEDPYYRAGGLLRTINASTSVVYATQGNPTLQGLTLDCVSDVGLNAQVGERGYGAAVETLEWTGGDAELELKVGGKFIDKDTRGKLDSITVTNIATTLACTVEESYRLLPGYYLCEAECIRVTAFNPGGTSVTIARGQLSTAAVAHTAQPLVPYTPTLTNPTGRPIPESTSTLTFDGIALRATKWGVKMTTGIAHLPGETGSQRVQGLKAVRYGFEVSATLVLHEDYVSLLGKSTARRLGALTLVQGTGAGRIATFSLPFAELVAPAIEDSADDIAMVNVAWRVRDNSASDAFSLTLT